MYKTNIKEKFSLATVEKSIAYTLFDTSEKSRLSLQQKFAVAKIKNEIISKIGEEEQFEFKSILICNFIKNNDIFKAKEYIFEVVPGEYLNQPFFIDQEAIIYDSWKKFKKENGIAKRTVCYPKHGCYQIDRNGTLLIQFRNVRTKKYIQKCLKKASGKMEGLLSLDCLKPEHETMMKLFLEWEQKTPLGSTDELHKTSNEVFLSTVKVCHACMSGKEHAADMLINSENIEEEQEAVFLMDDLSELMDDFGMILEDVFEETRENILQFLENSYNAIIKYIKDMWAEFCNMASRGLEWIQKLCEKIMSIIRTFWKELFPHRPQIF